MKKLLSLSTLLLSCLTLFAQESNYSILLYNDVFQPEANARTWVADRAERNLKTKTYKLVQFEQIPTEQTKQLLQRAGITLGDYIPNYAYIAHFQEGYNPEILLQANTRAIADLDKRIKLSPELFQENYPPHAVEGNDILLKLHHFNDVLQSQLIESISGWASIISEDLSENALVIRVDINFLDRLIKIEEVKYLEPIAPEPILEDPILNSNGRHNWLNSNVGGLNYTGLGYSLAAEEAGIVDPAEHIELHGRFTENATGSVSSHKTGVARRIGGAGNRLAVNKAVATGSDIYSEIGHANYLPNFSAVKLRSVNHSYGYGVGLTAWSTGTVWDGQVRDSVGPTHTWSAGNVGSSTSTYGPYDGIISGYANLTGGIKQAKNTFTVGSLNELDILTGFSSRGPTYDGRIKPDVVILGRGGTSYAAPKVSGVMGQLMHAYNDLNANTDPHLSLLKAIVLNTCDDLENYGPDYRTGYGRVNCRRALETIQDDRHLESTISQGGVNTHMISVPAGVVELRVLVHWPDYPAATTLPLKALVNDLDLTVTDPGSTTYLPWVLDPTANVANLSAPALRKVDTLNNTEQVTLSNPAAGNYTVTVNGTLVPQGPQKYYLTYEFLYDELTLTYPIGKEHFVLGENEYILWDSYGGTGTFDLDYSTDNGGTWTSIATGISATDRAYQWSVPNETSGEMKVRVSRGALSSTSIETFNIMELPTGLDVGWVCGDTVLLQWDPLPAATSYRLTRLGTKYMEEIGVTTNTYFIYSGASSTMSEWFSVQAYGANDALSRRVIPLEVPPGDQNCFGADAEVFDIIQGGYFPDCSCMGKIPVKVNVRNSGTQSISNFPLKYQLNNGTIYTDTYTGTLTPGQQHVHVFSDSITLSPGTNNLKTWSDLAVDANHLNDSMSSVMITYSSGCPAIPYTQNFDGFTTCSTAWGCEEVSCAMEQMWYNSPNTPAIAGDSIDWRTDANGTGTGSTGPSGDHTTGSGNYLYLEGSSADGTGCRNKMALLNSPCIDLSYLAGAELSFLYHMYGSSIGSLHLDVFSGGRWDEDVMIPIIGEQGNAWLERVVDLNAYEGQVVFIRFRGYTGNGFHSDLAIDDIQITGVDAPQVFCQDVTVQLDGSGNGSLAASDVDNGSNHPSGIASLALDPSTFDCTHLGDNTVILTVTATNGSSSSCDATVTVKDEIAPTAICTAATVQLDATASAHIDPSDVDAGSSDACGISSLHVVPNSFNCGDVGIQTVTLTVTDNDGNTSSCTASVTVEGFADLDYTWTGSIDTNWMEPMNWDIGCVPDENANVIIPITTLSPVICVADCAVCRYLEVEMGASLDVLGTLEVNASGGNSVQNEGVISVNGTIEHSGSEILNNGIIKGMGRIRDK